MGDQACLARVDTDIKTYLYVVLRVDKKECVWHNLVRRHEELPQESQLPITCPGSSFAVLNWDPFVSLTSLFFL